MVVVPYHYYKAKIRKLWSIIYDLRKELAYARGLLHESGFLRKQITNSHLYGDRILLKGAQWDLMSDAGLGTSIRNTVITQVRDQIQNTVIQDIRQSTGTDENRGVR